MQTQSKSPYFSIFYFKNIYFYIFLFVNQTIATSINYINVQNNPNNNNNNNNNNDLIFNLNKVLDHTITTSSDLSKLLLIF